jgi:hypothetical protein
LRRQLRALDPQPGRLQASANPEALTHLWQCGPVCDDPDELPRLVETALRRDTYAPSRESLLHYRATARAIAALEPFLEGLAVIPWLKQGAQAAKLAATLAARGSAGRDRPRPQAIVASIAGVTAWRSGSPARNRPTSATMLEP